MIENMKTISHKEVGMKLDELKVGDKAKVIKLNVGNKEIRRHLLDMGVTRGVIVTIKKIAPMGDPIDLQLRDYELCISKSELDQIEVEAIK
jgi:ferrous iron transport protein A